MITSITSFTSIENLNLSCLGNNQDYDENILFLIEIDLDKNEPIKGFNTPNNDTGFTKFELTLNVIIFVNSILIE